MKGTDGDAVVEATILFPIMIMIFVALVFLAAYLPTRAALQRATQYAATAIAVENSDTWLFFDEMAMAYYWETDKDKLKHVYAAKFPDVDDVRKKAEDIVIDIESRNVTSKAGVLAVDAGVVPKIFHKEIVVTATREFTVPMDLSFVRFPETILVTASSTASVQNAEEFVRNIDMAVDFAEFIHERYNLTGITDAITSFRDRVSSFLGP